MKRLVVMAVLGVLAVTSPAYPFGLGDLGKVADSVAGGSAGGGVNGQITLATVKFLSGSEKLADATGDMVAAKQYAEMRKKAERGDTVDLSEVSTQMEKLSRNEAKLKAAETSKVKDAAVDVGVASLIQTKAVAAMSANPTLVAQSPAASASMLQAAPTNLKAMVSVQGALYSYLKAKGEDPEADARKAAASLEKS